MEKFASKKGIRVKAYKGDAMTLLAFDLAPAMRQNLAGFTIFYSVKGKVAAKPVYNRLKFSGRFLKNNPAIPAKGVNSTLYSPLQKMNWVHVPNTDIDSKKALFGQYTYEVTPRYIVNGKLLPLDKKLTVKVTIDVSPFDLNNMKINFTRGFVSSVAYAQRFGLSNNKVRPAGVKDKLLFDIKQKSGTASRWHNGKKKNVQVDYSFEEQHDWLGWQARKTILAFLDEAIKDKTITVKSFVYDLDEPEVAKRLLTLADAGRLKIIVDDSGKHGKPGSHESTFVREFKKTKADKKNVTRGKFGALSHSKIFIHIKNGKAGKVLTGSTNFSTNGLYVNSNHVIVVNNAVVAALYEEVFEASFGKKNMKAFKGSVFSKKDYSFSTPDMTVTFAPHPKTDADRIFSRIAGKINSAASDVLFAIMKDNSKSGILDAVKKKVQDTGVFTYGITDTIGKSNNDYTVHVYKPDSKLGVRVAAKGVQNILPPPLGQVPGISGYAIHHKFIVVDFKGEKPVVFCGSSNLAYQPEQKNGDNLLEIRDPDVVTAFAIEALRLVDHFHWRNYEDTRSKPMNLDDLTRQKPWSAKWFTPGNLYCKQRELYMR